MSDKHTLPASLLAPNVDPGRLGFEDTSEIEPLEETIGQERAVEALEFGLQMNSSGFNIFVSGPVGTGKGTLVRQMVKRLAQTAPSPADWCYVHNFQDASRPTCLSFPAGQGPPSNARWEPSSKDFAATSPPPLKGKNTSTRRRRSSRTRKEEKIALSRTHDTLSPAGVRI